MLLPVSKVQMVTQFALKSLLILDTGGDSDAQKRSVTHVYACLAKPIVVTCFI